MPPMTRPEDLPYKLRKRRMIAETNGLRVQILTLDGDEEVPWHYHTEISDTFICLDGPMVVEMKDPPGDRELETGDVFDVPPGTPHRVVGKDGGYCRFVIVQGIGEHDFIPVGDD